MSAGYDGDFTGNAAHAEAARRIVDSTARYLRRGRSHQDRPDAELARAWVTVMHAWASAPLGRPAVLDDLESEFALRGLVPPHGLVRDEIGRLAAYAMAQVARMPEEERRAEGGRIVGRHLGEWTRRN